VDLMSLISFFKNPAKFLLERRLRMKFTESEAALNDREPFEIGGREKYQIEQEVLERVVAGEAPAQTAKLLHAGGALPLGRAGEAALTALQRDAADFRERLARFAPDQPRPPLALDLALGAFQLTGRLDHLTATGLLRFRCAKLKATDLLAVWIEHLAWNVLQPAGDSLTSAVVAKDDTIVFPPSDDARARLASLLDLYWRGLRTPLKLFPESAHKFIEAEHNAATGGRARRSPLAAARSAWEGSSYQNGPRAERDDPWFALCFRDLDDPLDEEFAELARSVFDPLLACAQKGEA
jgi:exodeoxyribonuclease V gamma subunit